MYFDDFVFMCLVTLCEEIVGYTTIKPTLIIHYMLMPGIIALKTNCQKESLNHDHIPIPLVITFLVSMLKLTADIEKVISTSPMLQPQQNTTNVSKRKRKTDENSRP